MDKKNFFLLASKKPVIAFFHQRIFILVIFLAALRPIALISQSDDGQLLSKVLSLLGIKMITGSTGKENAVKATLSLIKIIKKGKILITTLDGPLGPASKVKKGALYMSSISKRPLLLMSAESDRYWEFKSWDKFRIPKPFSNIRIEFLDLAIIPSKLKTEEFEEKRKELEKKLITLDKNIGKKFSGS